MYKKIQNYMIYQFSKKSSVLEIYKLYKYSTLRISRISGDQPKKYDLGEVRLRH